MAEPARYEIERVVDERQRSVVKRLFGEYQRGVELLLETSDICP